MLRSMLPCLVFMASAVALAQPTDFSRVGITHWDGRYNFTSRPILEEGADRIWDLGARVIKFELDVLKVKRDYDHNTEWRDYATARELVASPGFAAAINRPWRWVNFQITTPQRTVPITWCDGMSAEEIEAERKAFYDLTAYLLQQYAGSGINFLLDNWEGDNALDRNVCFPEGGGGANWTVRDGMVKWLSARQRGIEQARAAIGEHGVHVYGGAECNSTPDTVWPPGTGSQCGENVLPHLDPPPDLCGLSAYRRPDGTDMSAALGWLKERCNARRTTPSPLGSDNLYVAEFGAASTVYGDDVQQQITRAQAASAIALGAELVIYWQLYCNECLAGCPNRPVRDGDMRGFWLIRPEPRESGGTPTPTWRWLYEVLAAQRSHPAPPRAGRRWRLVARPSGRCLQAAGSLTQAGCDADRATQEWRVDASADNTAQLKSQAGGCMQSQGDKVTIAKCARSGVAQKWTIAGVTGSGAYHTLRRGDRCLTLDGGSYDDGTRLSLRACDGGTAQQFWLQDRGKSR